MIQILVNNQPIDAYNINLRISGSGVRRTVRFTCPAEELEVLLPFGQLVEILDGSEYLFTGYVDDISERSGVDAAEINVLCRDVTKKLKEAIFEDDITFDGEADPSAISITSIEPSSEMGSGDDISLYADVYRQEATASSTGTPAEIDVSGDIRLDGLKASQPGARIEVDSYLDLKSIEQLRINLEFDGLFSEVQISQDGVLWSSYEGGAVACRYIQVTCLNDDEVSVSLSLTSSETYSASHIEADDGTSWRPATFDLNREITFNLNSPANVLYLTVGLNNADRRALYGIDVYYYRRGRFILFDEVQANAGQLEIDFGDIETERVKLRLKRTDSGRPAIRFASFYNVDAKTIDQIIEEVAADFDVDAFNLKRTRRSAEITFESGRSVWDQLTQLVDESLGWDLYFDSQGVLTLSDTVFDISRAYEGLPVFDPFTRTFSDADIKNKIIAIHESDDGIIKAEAVNDLGYSPTSTFNIGKRAEIIRSESSDSIEKLRLFANKKLREKTSMTIPASFQTDYRTDLTVNDVVKIKGEYYIIKSLSINLDAEGGLFTLNADMEAL